MNAFESAIKKYLDIFESQEMYFVNDNRNLELFAKNPSNKTEEDIRIKTSAINDDLEIRQLPDINDMIAHILKLNIDDRLQRGDLSLVEDIANITVNDKSYHFLHFASVYCNYHRPDVYPVYSEQHLGFYRKYIITNNLNLDPDKLNTYSVFSAALDDFLTRLGLKGKMNYLHIRKFGWLYFDHVVKESLELVH